MIGASFGGPSPTVGNVPAGYGHLIQKLEGQAIVSHYRARPGLAASYCAVGARRNPIPALTASILQINRQSQVISGCDPDLPETCSETRFPSPAGAGRHPGAH